MIIKNQIDFLKSRSKIFIVRNFEKTIVKIERIRIKKKMLKSNSLLLIHTIGKVGSSSVYSSLQGTIHGNNMYHFHALNENRIKKEEAYYRSSLKRSIPYHLIKSKIVSELLKEYKGDIKIFSLIREPITRELSSIFQDSFNFSSSINLINEDMQDVINDKIEQMSKELPEIEWFDKEIQSNFGINVYDSDFDVEKGYQFYENGKAKLLLMRIDSLNDRFNEACQLFFSDTQTFYLEKDNISDDKFYNDSYRSMTKKCEISDKQLNGIINSKFVHKFYHDKITKIKDRWA